jgi:ATP-dependent 26S proteasome regulatory subunit
VQTNRPESVDPALRRPGRFDREFEITVPNEDERFEILQIHTRGMPISEDVDLKQLSLELHGYTGADIKSLCRESAMKSIRRYLPDIDLETEKISSEILQSMQIKLIDFLRCNARSGSYCDERILCRKTKSMVA